MYEDEKPIEDRTGEIELALKDAGVKAQVFYEDDGDEGWHITISAGREILLDGGGCDPEFGLTYWTRSGEWLWQYVGQRYHQRSGPWPERALGDDTPAAEVAEYVADGLRRYGHGDCTDPDCGGGGVDA